MLNSTVDELYKSAKDDLKKASTVPPSIGTHVMVLRTWDEKKSDGHHTHIVNWTSMELLIPAWPTGQVLTARLFSPDEETEAMMKPNILYAITANIFYGQDLDEPLIWAKIKTFYELTTADAAYEPTYPPCFSMIVEVTDIATDHITVCQRLYVEYLEATYKPKIRVKFGKKKFQIEVERIYRIEGPIKAFNAPCAF
ncbi:hypothetical protein M501DRAFT_1017262 [Patellaria atrata CBS 101060]|uniref:Uncharacterized protein n=1 Tax=Patellaria atrata CBS 101060 TaxID=1346257 RepID=A0A9P4VQX5_9PEZI|nr:hypothetical protein M501DRAFT_1017262 [Patellaria atrata CBS 101060]